MAEENYFRDYMHRTDDLMINKMDHYLDVYHRVMAPRKNKDIRFLEIGIWKGGSINLWKGFFGSHTELTFLDIDPKCKALEGPRVSIEIGDQSDRAFLRQIAKNHGPFDVIVDDGGHKMHQQKTSFVELWAHLSDGGLYIVEDTHSSYWPGFGGGFREKNSFIEFSKDLVDRFHSWYTDQDDIFPFHPIAKQLASVQFYDSMVIFEKSLKKEAPKTVTSTNGIIKESHEVVQMRGRKSIF